MDEDVQIDEEEFKQNVKIFLLTFGLPIIAGGFRLEQSTFEAWFSWIILKGFKSLVIVYAGVLSFGYCTFLLSRIARYIAIKEERKGFTAFIREVTPDVYLKRVTSVATTFEERAGEETDTGTDTIPLPSFLLQQDRQLTSETDRMRNSDEYDDDEHGDDEDYSDGEYDDEDGSERSEDETSTTSTDYELDEQAYDSDDSWTTDLSYSDISSGSLADDSDSDSERVSIGANR